MPLLVAQRIKLSNQFKFDLIAVANLADYLSIRTKIHQNAGEPNLMGWVSSWCNSYSFQKLTTNYLHSHSKWLNLIYCHWWWVLPKKMKNNLHFLEPVHIYYKIKVVELKAPWPKCVKEQTMNNRFNELINETNSYRIKKYYNLSQLEELTGMSIRSLKYRMLDVKQK